MVDVEPLVGDTTGAAYRLLDLLAHKVKGIRTGRAKVDRDKEPRPGILALCRDLVALGVATLILRYHIPFVQVEVVLGEEALHFDRVSTLARSLLEGGGVGSGIHGGGILELHTGKRPVDHGQDLGPDRLVALQVDDLLNPLLLLVPLSNQTLPFLGELLGRLEPLLAELQRR